MISIKRAAIALAAGGAALGLITMGVGASFSDSAIATETIHVGTFGITVTSTTPGASVVGNTVTVTLPSDIQSSAPGTAPMVFTVKSTGSIPALVHVVKSSTLTTPFYDLMLSAPADVTLAQNATANYSGGIGWSELFQANEGQVVTVTYTITASA
jgi:predicted ribosomally synthesized peptide with SipW-like signal peptide